MKDFTPIFYSFIALSGCFVLIAFLQMVGVLK